MKEENNSYLGFALFFFFIVILIFTGSFLLYYNQKIKITKEPNEGVKVVLTDKLKENKEEDFIYYSPSEMIAEDLQISYKKAFINLNSEDAKEVNALLDELYSNALTTIKRPNEETFICENGSTIYEAKIIDYASFYYDKYITLLVTENNYTCTEEIEESVKVHSYTFDGTTGKRINQGDLLNVFHLTYTEFLQKLENHLQSTIEDAAIITETLNKLKENETYTIYISETNKLTVKYIVKTNSVDYNDIIELN